MTAQSKASPLYDPSPILDSALRSNPRCKSEAADERPWRDARPYILLAKWRRLPPIEIRVAAAHRRWPGKTDSPLHGRVGKIQGGDVHAQLFEERGQLVAQQPEQLMNLRRTQRPDLTGILLLR